MGEFFLELFVEIIGELFIESSIDLSRSKYVPKWLRITAITMVIGLFGGLLMLIVWSIFDKNIVIVTGIIIAVIWLFLIIKALTVKTKKYEYVTLDDGSTFKGKRTYLGFVIGKIRPKSVHNSLNEDGEIKVIFERTDDFPEKEQNAVIEEQEIQLLNELYNISEDRLSALINRGRSELMKKLSHKNNGYSNGSGLVLNKILYQKSPDEYTAYYYFKDKETGKKVKIIDKPI